MAEYQVWDEDIDEPRTLEQLKAMAAAGVPLPEGIEFETFGTRVAQEQEAFITDNRNSSEAKYNPIGEAGEEEKRIVAAKAVDWHETVAGMDEPARLNATRECLTRRDNFTPILQGVLEFCKTERSYDEIEEFVSTFPSFRLNAQSGRRYVFFLLRTGALDEIELGEDGEPLTQEMKDAAVAEGLDPEDVDTLIFDWRIKTTEVGEKIAAEFAPRARVLNLFARQPERLKTYLKVIEYCATKRNFEEISTFIDRISTPLIDAETRLPVGPGAYVNKLGETGALAWEDGWVATEVGRTILSEQADILA